MQQLFLSLLWKRAYVIKGEKRLSKIAGIFFYFLFRFAKKDTEIFQYLLLATFLKDERKVYVTVVWGILPLVLFLPVWCQGDEFSGKWARFSSKVGQKSQYSIHQEFYITENRTPSRDGAKHVARTSERHITGD